MPRRARAFAGGLCYHVLNRGNRKNTVFHDALDYDNFVGLIRSATARIPVRLLSYCLMPNHYHFVIWPRGDDNLSDWMHWLFTTHAMRYHRRYETVGRLWENRFKAFPIQQDHHLMTVMRYVERNPLRAKLVDQAEQWRWSSIAANPCARGKDLTTRPPIPLPANWVSWVNMPQTEAELKSLRHSANRGTPFGSHEWVEETAEQLGLAFTLKGRTQTRNRK